MAHHTFATFRSANPDFYQVLGVDEDASTTQINVAYEVRSRLHHLDELGISEPEDFQKQRFLIEHAYYVVLKGAERRESGLPDDSSGDASCSNIGTTDSSPDRSIPSSSQTELPEFATDGILLGQENTTRKKRGMRGGSRRKAAKAKQSVKRKARHITEGTEDKGQTFSTKSVAESSCTAGNEGDIKTGSAGRTIRKPRRRRTLGLGKANKTDGA